MSHFDYKQSYRRNLPHLQPAGATFFVTFRLAGSLPKSVIEQWQNERQWLEHLEQTNPAHFSEVKSDFERQWFAKFESVLDGGSYGPTWLKDERIAQQLVDSLHYRDGSVYRLDAFSIMPNHAHVVFKPLPLEDETNGENESYHSLASIMQSLKGFTAYKCNRLLGREGEFWAHESFDHFVRDHEEWMRIMAYVLNNPVKAGYVSQWQDWKWSYRRNAN
ncbi:MAG TPA: hypothetical protein VHQ95_06220 [Pyrinomonadaceae bacterium]|nr:hypothetical protein [Pyrinomonadaceae bacterium]